MFTPIDAVAALTFFSMAFIGVGAVPVEVTRRRYRRDLVVGAPPPWVFPVVWTALYAMIGTSGFLVWWTQQAGPCYWTALGAYVLNILLSKAWTPVFFELRQPKAALGILVLMQGTALAYLGLAALLWDTVAVTYTGVALYVPYVLWCTYALFLNGQYVRLQLNRVDIFAEA